VLVIKVSKQKDLHGGLRMAKKKELLIEYELEFLEDKLIELKEYISANPISKLADRMAWKETKNGGSIPICIANKEAQRKDLTQALKDYAEILQTVKNLREKEEQKQISSRGDKGLSPFETGEI
jgi:hypothetical protein